MALAKSQKSLLSWGKEDWGTKSGKKSSETGERYLPKAAIKSLSSSEYSRTSAKKRADTAAGKQHSKQPKKIAEERFVLAQKYGYDLPDTITDSYLLEEKDPKQVFYGLHPGWLVNLADKEIYKPTEEEHLEYYKT